MQLISLKDKQVIFLRKSESAWWNSDKKKMKRAPTPEEHEESMSKLNAPGPHRELTAQQHAEITKPRDAMNRLAHDKKWFTKEYDKGKGRIGKGIKNPTGISGNVRSCPTCHQPTYMHPKDTQCEHCERKDIRRTVSMGKGIRIVLLLRKTLKGGREHPVSEAQRRMAFVLEKKGELPPGKAVEWSRRKKGKHLPEHTKDFKAVE